MQHLVALRVSEAVVDLFEVVDVEKGSIFHFTLLLELGNEERESRRAALETLHSLPVLVVDDNDTNRKILRQILHNWEMAPQTAASGPEALSHLAAARDAGAPLQLVLLDLMMPEMSGLEVARRISEDFGEDAPEILVLTSAGQPIPSDQATELGIDRTLTKPVKQSELLDAISRLFGTSTRDEKREDNETDADPVSVQPMNVLLAEDGRVNQMVAIRLLEKRGHSVTLANDGQAAVELFGKHHFDAILMDLQMPRMDGFAATQAIRQVEQETGQRIPIIAMTANAMKGDREKCLDAGMDDYVAKPVRSEELYAILEKYTPVIDPPATNESADVSVADPGAEIVFDEPRFRREMGDEDLMRELLDLFPQEIDGFLGRAQQAVAAGDATELHAAAHSLKGTIGTYCAPAAHHAAKSLDDLARAGDLSQATEQLATCEREITRLRQALADFRSRLEP